MSDIHSVISATGTLATWFMSDQMDETYTSVLEGGTDELKDYAIDFAHSNGIEVDLDAVDYAIAYLIIRDWDKRELWRVLADEVVCEYMGIDRLSDDLKPSAATKANSFNTTLGRTSAMTQIPLRTLNDWFTLRKLSFHAALEFSQHD